MNIYVGNLSYSMTEEELKEIFTEYGEISTVNLITDKYTGQSKGFAFVEMVKQADAETAIKELNGKTIKGMSIKVNQARPRGEKPRRPRY
ncbi:RNA-binding protein [Beggiatoa sp. PS]|nr:RNA-binding protein [Beggiatoa sp. PS]